MEDWLEGMPLVMAVGYPGKTILSIKNTFTDTTT